MKNLIKNFEQFVNEAWDPSDNYEPGVYSNCCGAEVIHGDICAECGEHCDVEDDYEDFDNDQAELNGRPILKLVKNGDGSFTVKYEDGESDTVYVSNDDWDKLNDIHRSEELYEKKSRKEVLKDAKEKYPNLKPGSMKKGLEKMKGKDFSDKAKKNFGWADNPAAAAAAYIRKATGKEPKDV